MTLLDWLSDKGANLSNLWDSLDLSILWQWLPSDLQTWIASFIVILFILAVKRLILN